MTFSPPRSAWTYAIASPTSKGREGIIAADTKPLTSELQSPGRQTRHVNTKRDYGFRQTNCWGCLWGLSGPQRMWNL